MEQKDVTLYHTADSYSEANFGIDWVSSLLKEHHREGKWNLVVDADELLVLEEEENLRSLCRMMEETNKDALGTILVDLYSDKPIRETPYRPGIEILEECCWHDKHVYTTFSPYGGPHRRGVAYQGGVRSRTFGIDTVVLNKVPLFRYRSQMKLREGMHWIEGADLLHGKGLLLHFKFIDSFHNYAEREAKRGEHWNDASEYKKYHYALQRNPLFSLYDPVLSVRYRGVRAFFDQYPCLWEEEEKRGEGS